MGGKAVIKQKKAPGRLLIELAILLVVLAGGTLGIRYGLGEYYDSAYPLEYRALVDAACAEKNLDPALVYAVIRTESGFRPDAVSNVGARGLMQMMPDAFEWVQMRKGESGLDQDLLFQPEISIEYGTSMLRLLLDEFKTDTNVLCAYHAGWGSVQSWLKNPDYAPNGKDVTNIPFRDTAHYVDKVTRAADMYRKLYEFL